MNEIAGNSNTPKACKENTPKQFQSIIGIGTMYIHCKTLAVGGSTRATFREFVLNTTESGIYLNR